jgi:hypothetical protein
MWVVYYWIDRGLITAQRKKPGLPYAITLTDATPAHPPDKRRGAPGHMQEQREKWRFGALVRRRSQSFGDGYSPKPSPNKQKTEKLQH